MANNLGNLQEKRFEVPPVVNICPLSFAEANSNDGHCCDSRGLAAL